MKSLNHNIVNRFLTNLFFIFLLGVFSLGFSQNQIEQEAQKSIFLPEKTIVSENITYKTNNEKPLLLDIYKPKNSSSEKLPVLIYVHGGGWVGGEKTIHADTYIENTILKLVERNYAVISIEYTLVNETVHFPLPIQDTKDAIRWVRKNAEKYNFDANNIGLFGASAGSHLSMLAAYTKDNEFVGAPELSGYSAKVNYVVNNFGPTDLNTLLHTRAGKIPVFFINLFAKNIVELRSKIVLGMSGYDIKKDKRKIVEYFKTISPISYVDHGIPTLILQGNKDKVVPMQQSKKLKRKLRKENIANSLTIVKDGVHGFRTTDKAYLEQLSNEMVDFIIAHKK
ncbi:alpha/beta hydrolase [Chryseobacterium gwangjuense]|uniref:alpha/beta hydrolase n=1 Tax=Chryseobacterium gwangjuense TaxID=1069980 RepID=UPI001E5BB04A|nr:alpha/beta hydrolase [Chryseobacterium gwangjuense]MCE3075649.1 alpha/beta hydrolase [Chryseobacterium gwangjuense]